ncbi:DUF4240 domain-containing protein [Actinoplanes sp. M2I2]|uniref:DUF4240 domain-containing protein n=1 Tax=Actinoplanes sp. M2I2 TaxID=1734444 RepID=UPI002021BD57|nr:DUF4240 domain-containing protein [Actinoplanes sp. M2I2]
MLSENEFWRLVATPGRRADDGYFDRLTAALAERPEADITGFADRLAAALWALDTPAHFAAVGSVGDDSFLYIRCVVVTAGRKAYERVLGKPAALRGYAGDEAELLLTVAERAYEQATGLLWEHETPVSYETGSNTAAWGEPAPESEHDPVAVTPSWLELEFGSSGPDGPPHAYVVLLHAVVDAVAADDAWRQWWEPAGVPVCELSLLLDPDSAPEATVKRGRKRIRVQVARDPGPFSAIARDALPARAAGEIRDLLGLARERLGLGPMPPLESPPMPADLPAESFEPDPGPVFVPGLPDELLQAAMRDGGLSPDQVVAYFRAHPDADGADIWLGIGLDGR